MQTNQRFRKWLALTIFLIAIVSSGRVQAVTFTSTQSGSWGNPATWGGVGVPGCGDDAIISTGHTVTLDSNIGGLGCNLNITINNGGTLDLGGFELNYSGNNTTFTNNGTFTNSGTFNRLRSENGGANFTFAGQGTYSGNLKLENVSAVWHIAANTSFTFSSATNNANIQIDHPAGLDLGPNDLILVGPSSGSNYVIFDKATGAGITGTGSIKTQGNIRIKAPVHIDRPVETVSGAAQAEGEFRTGWIVDAGASLTLSGTLRVSNLNAGNGLIIPSGATVDLAGNELDIAWNGPFTNNGTVDNSGAFNRIVFMDNGVHTVSGVGLHNGNVGLEVLNNFTNIAVGSSLTFGAPAGNTNIQVDSGANLTFAGPGSLTLSGQVLNNGNNGALNMNSGGANCADATKIVIRSNVTGTQRPWNGNTVLLVNVDVKDQAGTATVNTTGSANSGNNGANWTFSSPCSAGTPTPTPTPTPMATPTPTATPTPAPTATPTPTPQPTASQLLNIATRMRVQTGENVLIGGFIITGTDPKRVIIRGIGPSLSSFFSGALVDPTLELFEGSTLLMMNDNWRTDQEAEIMATGIPPTNDFESAIVRTLTPGAYTAILRGKNNTTGIGVVEAYDLDRTANSKLANIATRGFVETGDNVMIGGLIIGPAGGGNVRIVVRAIGPSLTAFGIPGALQDPTLDLVNSNGVTIRSNNNWRDSQEAEIIATGLAPSDNLESALVETVAPGSYTAIVRGVGPLTGVALVEVYHLQ